MKMRWEKLTALFILPVFLIQGCGYWMIDMGTVYDDRPYEVKDSGVQRATAPYEKSEPRLVKTETGQEALRESFVPDHWEVIDFNGIPPGAYPYPIFDKDPVWKVDKSKPNSFKAIEDMAKEKGYAILKNDVDFPAKMTSGSKPANSARIYLIPRGKYIVYRPEEQTNGDIILHPIEVPSCRNQLVWAPKLKWVPRTKTISKVRIDKEIWMGAERYADKQVITEKYLATKTQIDAGVTVAAGLLGLGLGYLIWFGHAATASSSIVIKGCPSGVCGAGAPAPRPGP